MIYGHPAPCIVTLIDGGPAMLVEPLRFTPLSDLPLGRAKGRAPNLNYGARPVEAHPLASTGHQMRAVSTPRSPSGSCPPPAPLGHPF